jgi:DNA sulfur modification protein DndB
MEHSYVFPAIRGVQAGREYYVSMCPLRIIPKIFIFDEEELGPEMRAQRTLNENRIPEMARYILENRDDYVFSALTASIDGDVEFESAGSDDDLDRLGELKIPMTSRFVINDGQHRRAAIEMAMNEDPTLASETIAVVFFVDAGLERSQQMFSDLNRHDVKASKSLGVLYDHRDEASYISRLVVFNSDFFDGLVELEKTSLSLRSRKLFTLSALHNANEVLLDGLECDSAEDYADRAIAYWEEVAEHIETWQKVHANEMTAGDVRDKYLTSHSITLEALARVGNELLVDYPETWREKLEGLVDVDWSRDNAGNWEGRALNGGRVTNSRQNTVLVANLIKQHLGVPLTDDQAEVEEKHEQVDAA